MLINKYLNTIQSRSAIDMQMQVNQYWKTSDIPRLIQNGKIKIFRYVSYVVFTGPDSMSMFMNHHPAGSLKLTSCFRGEFQPFLRKIINQLLIRHHAIICRVNSTNKFRFTAPDREHPTDGFGLPPSSVDKAPYGLSN